MSSSSDTQLRSSAKLTGKVCLVTGAARGIGRAVAQRFAEEGAVVYGVDQHIQELEVQMQALSARGLSALACPADLTRPEEVKQVIDQITTQSSGLDVLANVAGIIALKTLEETTLEEWDRILAVNLRAPFLTCQAAASTMKRAGRGSIINVSSRAGVMGFADEVAYCASKWGLEGLSRAIADGLGPHGVAVNTLTPGTPTHTAMSEQTYGAETRKVWRDPSVITSAFVYLALQTSSGLHNHYVDAWELSERLRSEGWEV